MQPDPTCLSTIICHTVTSSSDIDQNLHLGDSVTAARLYIDPISDLDQLKPNMVQTITAVPLDNYVCTALLASTSRLDCHNRYLNRTVR